VHYIRGRKCAKTGQPIPHPEDRHLTGARYGRKLNGIFKEGKTGYFSAGKTEKCDREAHKVGPAGFPVMGSVSDMVFHRQKHKKRDCPSRRDYDKPGCHRRY
jgi:hypothetical protein